MKQGVWTRLTRLQGSWSWKSGHNASADPCSGRRDLANATSCQSPNHLAKQSSGLVHCSQGSLSVLPTAHESAWKQGSAKWMFLAGTAAGATGVLAVGALSSSAFDKFSLGNFRTWAGHAARQVMQEAWADGPSQAVAGMAGTRQSALKGVLGPNFIADAAAKAAPAVVNISLHGNGLPVQNGTFEAGSGFIIAPDGTIVTNAHVLGDALDGATKSSRPIMVSLQDERVFEARVVSYDRVSDLAILKIDADQPLPCAKLGTSSQLRVGEWVLAMGSPLHLQNSVTAGIVSCVDRKAVELGLARAQSDYIQTDAAVNSGNSGGPLVNLCGEVVGISSMKAVSADGVSFAIPMDTAKDIIHQLIENGRVVRPYIGIKMLQLNSGNVVQLRKRDPSFPDVVSGILVPHVTIASPAHKAGLRPGDVITGFAGQTEATTQGLTKALGQHVGKSMELRVKRRSSDSTVVLQVTASEASS